MNTPPRGPQDNIGVSPPGKAPTTWLGIRAEIMTRISNGTYPAGTLIPTEQELAAEFACARATVNRALTSLAERGVLERRRRIGTRVAEGMGAPVGTIAVPVIRHLTEERGYRFRAHLMTSADRPAPPAVAERLFRSAPADLRELRTQFFADDELFCAEQRWVDMAALPGLTAEALETTTANEWIAVHGALTLMEQAMRACSARDADADAMLGCPAGAPVLVYDTCLWVGAAPVSWARHSFIPGFVMSQSFMCPGASLLSSPRPA